LTFALPLWFNEQLVTVGVIRTNVFFSIELTYPVLNLHVGVGQRGVWIKGVKCMGRNPFLAVLCRIVRIPVNRSSDKRGLTIHLRLRYGWHWKQG